MVKERPTKESLIAASNEHKSMWRMGRFFGVTGPTVASWFDFYELEKPKAGRSWKGEKRARIESKLNREEVQRVIDEYKTIAKAARVIGMNGGQLRSLCVKYGVKYPGRAESLRIERGLKYTKEELENLLLEYKTREKVAKRLGVKSESLKKLFVRYGLPIVSRAEGVRIALNISIPMSEKLMEILDGLILGDGGLLPSGVGTAKFQLGTSFIEYANCVANVLNDNGLPCKVYSLEDKQIGKHRTSTGFRHFVASTITLELGRERSRWYPSGKKIVPKDIRSVPSMWKWVYVGDGHLAKTSDHTGTISFALCDFTDSEVDFLVDKAKDLGFAGWRRKRRGYNILFLSSAATISYSYLLLQRYHFYVSSEKVRLSSSITSGIFHQFHHDHVQSAITNSSQQVVITFIVRSASTRKGKTYLLRKTIQLYGNRKVS